ncbi:MAG: PilN domain-containing protein [Candidatus Omnitrophica bacterium]|nr:PilN domain-containing protein [Candidatus Omnitrophota bacterium]HOX54204.1 PilN domain-containing protein [Candidatus Omnitrophota bacterium]
MIEINLLPPELRRKEPTFKVPIPKETLFLFGGAVISVLIIIHLLLVGALAAKKAKFWGLNMEWQKIVPEKNKIDGLKNEQKEITEKIKSIEKLTKKGRISWAKKLNIMSDVLPQGVWIRLINFTGKELTIEGSSVSLRGEEVILVNKFASALKNNTDFYSDFKDLEVGTIKRRQIKTVEVADFTLVANFKEK